MRDTGMRANSTVSRRLSSRRAFIPAGSSCEILSPKGPKQVFEPIETRWPVSRQAENPGSKFRNRLVRKRTKRDKSPIDLCNAAFVPTCCIRARVGQRRRMCLKTKINVPWSS